MKQLLLQANPKITYLVSDPSLDGPPRVQYVFDYDICEIVMTPETFGDSELRYAAVCGCMPALNKIAREWARDLAPSPARAGEEVSRHDLIRDYYTAVARLKEVEEVIKADTPEKNAAVNEMMLRWQRTMAFFGALRETGYTLEQFSAIYPAFEVTDIAQAKNPAPHERLKILRNQLGYIEEAASEKCKRLFNAYQIKCMDDMFFCRHDVELLTRQIAGSRQAIPAQARKMIA